MHLKGIMVPLPFYVGFQDALTLQLDSPPTNYEWSMKELMRPGSYALIHSVLTLLVSDLFQD
jgi:hypothetical protein